MLIQQSMPLPTIDPKRLKSARKNAGLKQAEVAEKLGIPSGASAISNYESGYAKPPADTLVGMAALYGVQVEALCA
jgi:transcriptional regulator with XRE-family HTH domain